MKTRLDETNKMRKLMGLSLLTEQIKSVEPDTTLDPDFEPHLSEPQNRVKVKVKDWYKERKKITPLKVSSQEGESSTGETQSKLDQQIGLSQKDGEQLEDELVSLMGDVNKLKDEKQINREKVHTLFKQLRTNKITGRMLKREKRKVDRLQKQIDKLENTTPETRKAQTKKILKDISIILTAGISALFMKDHPMVKALIQKVNKATDLPRLH